MKIVLLLLFACLALCIDPQLKSLYETRGHFTAVSGLLLFSYPRLILIYVVQPNFAAIGFVLLRRCNIEIVVQGLCGYGIILVSGNCSLSFFFVPRLFSPYRIHVVQ